MRWMDRGGIVGIFHSGSIGSRHWAAPEGDVGSCVQLDYDSTEMQGLISAESKGG